MFQARQAEKNKIAILRSMEPPRKRVGRQVMYRSQPVRRKVKLETKTETQEELDEIKYFT